ncbi:IS6 family transposase [Ruegeria sp. HKCCA4812]|uniref:IS6 family transposase n=1 Tax=Ruegeria sp. HKCCA4812 TaxID=2682993 RepID=UPI00148861F6|nr:IS6 family transposase [Ruegeria sp. HKCCA4812]
MVSLKDCHFPKDVVLYAVFFYLRYNVSYRDLEEIMAERGVSVDHATLNRWVVKYSPMIAARAQSKKRPTQKSWRMDETYLRVRGKWVYLYRANDKAANTPDFMLSERRNGPAATRFFAKALSSNGIPDKVVIDKSGANAAGIREVNRILKRFGCQAKVQTIKSKFLKNMIEQDHRFIKRRVRHMCGFKSLASASATLDGIEVANMIRKKHFSSAATFGFRVRAEIAG